MACVRLILRTSQQLVSHDSHDKFDSHEDTRLRNERYEVTARTRDSDAYADPTGSPRNITSYAHAW